MAVTIVSKFAIVVLAPAVPKPSSPKLAAIAAEQSYSHHNRAEPLRLSAGSTACVAQNVDILQLSTIVTLRKLVARSAHSLSTSGARVGKKSYIASLVISRKHDAASLAVKS